MSYNLNINKDAKSTEKISTATTLKRLLTLMGSERKNLYIALFFILINVGLNLIGPYLLGYTVDHYVVTKQFDGVIKFSFILLGIYSVALASGYTQAPLMRRVGHPTLLKLFHSIPTTSQDFPLDFFHPNKCELLRIFL